MKSLFYLVCCLGLNFISVGQSMLNINPPATNGQTKDFIPASPTAAGLGTFGQIPVGHYTGIPSIGVSLYNVSYKDLTVPIGISYHATGNKPDYFPGIVGLSWALNAGGSITRVVKGMPDYERYEIDPVIIPIAYNPTAEPNWNTLSKLNQSLSDGGFFTDQDRTNPDEFYFNFNGISGKFYMNQLASFSVKSAENRFYKVEGQVIQGKTFNMPILPQDPTMYFIGPYNNVMTQSKMLYTITITDDRGIKYVFGGTDNSIEFSRPGHSYGSHNNVTIDYLITPLTWHLTSIESPNGYNITLDYERGIEVTKVGYCDAAQSSWQRQGESAPSHYLMPLSVAMSEKSTLVNVCYPKSITTPLEKVLFTTSTAAEQLQFPPDPTIYEQGVVAENMFTWYRDIRNVRTQDLRSKKLDIIEIKDAQDNHSKSIHFNYTNNINTRLKLLAVTTHGNDYKPGAAWHFDYNTLPLPPYLTYKTDHYGFYNGRNPYITTAVSSYYITTLDQQAFFNSKEPDPNYVQAEILNKITYPTGGYTIFEYERNEYSTTVQTWPFTTVQGTNRITGGVRIKKITDYQANAQQATSKRYFYVKDYNTGGTVSSGVLAWQPVYYQHINGNVVPPAKYAGWTFFSGTIDFKQWSSNPIFPLGATRGNHVTYSEVTEVHDDGGSVVYKYKNYDNGYNDHPPVEKVSDNTNLKEFWKEEEGISMDLERGQILTEEMYDAANSLKNKKVYEYNADPNRFNEFVPVLAQTSNSIKRADIPSLRITASKIYTYFPFLKKVTQTEYMGPNKPTLQTIVSYEYDNQYRSIKKQTATTSDGHVISVLNSYPKDYVAAGTTDPYELMIQRGMVNVLIASEKRSDDLPLNKNITLFSKDLVTGATLILPRSIKTQYKNNPEETRTNFHRYDSKGNLVSSSPQDGIKTCYVWSYKYAFPVAKIMNAEYETVVDVLGGQTAVDDFANSISSDNATRSFLQPLKTDARLSNAMVTTYTYNPTQGITSATSPNNRNIYYEYDFMGRLSIVRDHNNNIVRKICYNYAGQPENCQVGSSYEIREFVYSPSSVTICNNGATLQLVTGYSVKPDPESSGIPLFPNEFFTDITFTTHLANGYYRLLTNGVPGNTRYQISGGIVVSTTFCL